MTPLKCRFWPTRHRFISVNNEFLESKWYSEMRAIIFECIYSLKPNKKQFWLIGSAQFYVHIFSNSFWLLMALPKQRKLHTSISKSALFWPFFHLIYKTKIKHCSGSYFPYVLTNLGQWPLAWYSGQLLPNVEWPMVASSNQVRLPFGRFVCLLQLPVERQSCAQASSRQPKSRATFWPFIKPGLVWISVGRWRFLRWFRR